MIAHQNQHPPPSLLHPNVQVQLDPVAFLDRADAVWQDYCAQMLTVRCIFLYLDRTFVISLPGLRSIFDMGLQLLRAHLEKNQQVRAMLLSSCSALVGSMWRQPASATLHSSKLPRRGSGRRRAVSQSVCRQSCGTPACAILGLFRIFKVQLGATHTSWWWGS